MYPGHIDEAVTDRDRPVDTNGEVEIQKEAQQIDDIGLVDELLNSDHSPSDGPAPQSDQRSSTRLGRLRSRATPEFSLPTFLVGTILSLVGIFLLGSLPIIGTVGGLLGVFTALFLVGVASSRSRYLESVLAGALAGGGSVVLGNLLFGLLSMNPLLLLGWLVGGGLVGGLGHYFGRDLRDGLTRDIDAD